MKRLSLVILLVLGLPGLSADHSWATEAPDPDALRPLRVQLKWTHQFQFAGYYAALHKGFYQDYGLDVSLSEHSATFSPIDQLMGGRAEFAVADTGALLYRSTGVPLVVLAAIFQSSPSILISRANDGIVELSDLRGRRATLAGGYMNAELMSMLQSVGLGVEDFALQPGSTSIETLIDGSTDAFNGYTTNEPFYLNQYGIPHIIFHPADYGVDFYGDILITRESLLESDPQLVRNFLDATLRGWEYAVENPAEMVDLILQHYNTQSKSREHLMFEAQEAIKLILPNVVPIGYMNIERWERIQTIFNEQGLLTQPVDMTQFIYMPQQSNTLLEVLKEYRVQIGSALLILSALLLIVHILRLRALVAERTRALQEQKRRAELEARTDPLTTLPNRRHFLEELGRDMSRAKRHNLPVSIISLDIDHFKVINDKYGHAAGDEALRQAAIVLKRNVRQGDLAARIGGEEFAIVCMDTNIEETRNLAGRLREEMSASTIDWQGCCFKICFSLGIAMRDNDDDVESLLRKADLALYEAKKNGRNQVCEWS